MKILEVIHGYPPEYNAGSENYTETLAIELARKGHDLFIFCREEDPSRPEYEVRMHHDAKTKITKYVINTTGKRHTFIDKKIDQAFERVLNKINPDIAHIEHLNHLSLNIPHILRKKGIRMVYTLHDFWFMCPRGQFIQVNNKSEPWKLCDGQEETKCATMCYSRYKGENTTQESELQYWTNWVSSRMEAVHNAVNSMDVFVSPSKTVGSAFLKYFPESENKLVYLDYGFDISKLGGRQRISKDDIFTFGYIGTHIPAKGVDYLLMAFNKISYPAKLRIWGRHRPDYTPQLMALSEELAKKSSNKVEWMGEFQSEKIVEEVFNLVDVMVVPSIWLENSPLVIHEAQQARVPVITADAGGMAEYVADGQNGLLFDFRNISSLTEVMVKVIENRQRIEAFGRKGYLFSGNGDIPSIDSHADLLLDIFNRLSA